MIPQTRCTALMSEVPVRSKANPPSAHILAGNPAGNLGPSNTTKSAREFPGASGLGLWGAGDLWIPPYWAAVCALRAKGLCDDPAHTPAKAAALLATC